MNDQPLTLTLITSAISMLVFSAVAWVLAIRLLVLARQTRQIPEVALALAYFFIAGVGYPMCAASIGAADRLGSELAYFLLELGSVIVRVGIIAMFVFTWQAFRPRSRWALGGCVLGSLAVVFNTVHILYVLGATQNFEEAADIPGTHVVTIHVVLISLAAYLWPAVESLRYYRLLKLRQALGLAKPIVVNRFLLWGAACSVSVVVSLINLSVIMRGLNIVGHAPALAASSLLGALASFLLIFAFLPPPSYVRFIDRRAARAIVS